MRAGPSAGSCGLVHVASPPKPLSHSTVFGATPIARGGPDYPAALHDVRTGRVIARDAYQWPPTVGAVLSGGLVVAVVLAVAYLVATA